MRRKMTGNIIMAIMAALMLTACANGNEPVQKEDEAPVVQTQETSDTETVQTQAEERQALENIPEAKAEDFRYIGLEDGTIKLQRYEGTALEVAIPEQIDGKDVTVIDGGCFSNKEDITTVIIPDTVKEIGNNAFMNCGSLVSVKMSANIEVIGDMAFPGTITEIELPNTLKEIGECAFAGGDFTEIELPTSLSEIEEGTFLQTKIESLVIPGNIKNIGKQAFHQCDFLKEVVLEDGVETIGEKAFYDCEVLEKVTIPLSVTEIDERAFSNSLNVTIVAEPGSYAETYAIENDIPYVNP